MSAQIRAGIIGIGGYTGLELVRILCAHPRFTLTYAAATSENELTALFPQLKGVINCAVEVADADAVRERCDVVFLALPHTQGMAFAKELAGEVRVVDLSADYRLSLENYEKNYCPHVDKSGLKSAVYGLVELNREKIKDAKLVANPGCYPTCSLLALAPFAALIEPKGGVMIDAKSGVSGAGKSLKATSHFVSVNENLNAYSPLTHRHADEIRQHLNELAGLGGRDLNYAGGLGAVSNLKENLFEEEGAVNSNLKLDAGEIDVLFVPNLAPLTRGMSASCFFTLREDAGEIDPLAVLREFYAGERFVRVREEPVAMKNVAGTHFCDVFAMKRGNKVWVNSAIDNLLKGASSQAVANANLMFGLDEGAGLPVLGTSI